MTIGFIDTETTGLHPYHHEIWEVALITDEGAAAGWRERRWFLPVNMSVADPIALGIGGYHKRHPMGHDFEQPEDDHYRVTDQWEFAETFAELTYGMHLACAIPSFDIPRLDDLLRKNHCLPEWHYHVICVESMLVGKYAVQPPWKSEDLLKAAGIGMPVEDKHTALGDARWARDVWLHCMRGSV